jgi:hypothetical protein
MIPYTEIIRSVRHTFDLPELPIEPNDTATRRLRWLASRIGWHARRDTDFEDLGTEPALLPF